MSFAVLEFSFSFECFSKFPCRNMIMYAPISVGLVLAHLQLVELRSQLFFEYSQDKCVK